MSTQDPFKEYERADFWRMGWLRISEKAENNRLQFQRDRVQGRAHRASQRVIRVMKAHKVLDVQRNADLAAAVFFSDANEDIKEKIMNARNKLNDALDLAAQQGIAVQVRLIPIANVSEGSNIVAIHHVVGTLLI